MQADKVTLKVDSKIYDRFVSYSVNSNLFKAGDDFEFRFFNTDYPIRAGLPCELFIRNGKGFNKKVLTGVVDSAGRTDSKKEGSSLIVSGRDLMGQLIDNHVPTTSGKLKTFRNIDLVALAKELLPDVSFLKNKEIKEIKKGNKNRLVELKAGEFDIDNPDPSASPVLQVSIGDSVFDVLSQAALSKGKLFFNMPDGTFIFGEPATSGTPEFFIKRGVNIIDSEFLEDISGQSSTVTVIAEKADDGELTLEDLKEVGTATNPVFNNLKIKKNLVVSTELTGADVNAQAAFIITQQQFEGFVLTYTVPGHSQKGKIWQPNMIARVDDSKYKLKGDFLVYDRTFDLSPGSDGGNTTTLILSKLGILPL